ncbi:MAG: apolipoprotein N-acyltransferase [Gammaproteobacteria bacterium]|nr:apolipoprotein N-acyltransferase [Gammaproteobacteria bacterium]
MITTLRNQIGLFARFTKISSLAWLWPILTGALLPLGFAPFHQPGAAILGVAMFFAQLQRVNTKQAFKLGWLLGLGYFGVGVSWVNTSIHTYGHLHGLIALSITSLFIAYLALFPGLCAWIFYYLKPSCSNAFQTNLLFSSVWCLSEYLRATCLTGFPWLMLGFGQIDTPLKFLLPLIGVYGVGFLTVLAATCLVQAMRPLSSQIRWLALFIFILITPTSLQSIHWTQIQEKPLSVGVIQANLSMRDKWDDRLFWKIIDYYQDHITALLDNTALIVLPESAIPVPKSYVHALLTDLHQQAQSAGSAILSGIPEDIEPNQDDFYNTITSLGHASGQYRKQHLVPFGEYIPKSLEILLQWLNLPLSNMQAGMHGQPLMTAHHHPFATLICYELAYPGLLRQQLPQAQWIVSISDDGWFGHSLAIYQHLQMAQATSLLSGRPQIVANNDGLSSIINPDGKITQSLPAFSPGVLKGMLYPTQGSTPWILWGDWPILGWCCIILCGVIWTRIKNKGSDI